MTRSSRLPGFYRRSVPSRVELLKRLVDLDPVVVAHIDGGGGLSLEVADTMSENVVAVHGLPLAVALNFNVNGKDHLVPMAVEEPSVVAAASNAARLVRESGGFAGDADASVMTAQIQFDDVPNPAEAKRVVHERRAELMALGDRAIPRMVARGGGCRDLQVRVLDEAQGVLVVDVFVDVGEAMGANLVDTVAEAMAPSLLPLVGGRPGLRILSNLPVRRQVRVSCRVDVEALGGQEAAEGIVRASRFADLDPYRAVTHNKGFMNGLSAAAVALGQDWRAIEAGAHGFAGLEGRYRPLSRWTLEEGMLCGRAQLPLAVGTVGGSTRVHAGVRAAFQLVAVSSARELAVVLAAAGLASNLAALKALAGEGIQRGHMALHRRKRAEEQAQAELQAQEARASVQGERR